MCRIWNFDEIRKVYPDIRATVRYTHGPAVYYQIPGFTGGIGFTVVRCTVSSCKNCNRIRLTSTGDLEAVSVLCGYLSIERLLRNGTGEEIRKQIKRAIE